MQKSIEGFFIEGCLRCSLGGTDQCKVVPKRPLLMTLRQIINGTELTETIKWGNPCYTIQGKNVLMFSALKDCVVLSFFKGSLLQDPKKILEKQGENSYITRIIRFAELEEIIAKTDQILAFIEQAIELEKSGAKVPKENVKTEIPVELIEQLETDKELKLAFEALTPGRKRSYYLYIGQAKQATTRTKRVEQCRSKIFLGKGWNEY